MLSLHWDLITNEVYIYMSSSHTSLILSLSILYNSSPTPPAQDPMAVPGRQTRFALLLLRTHLLSNNTPSRGTRPSCQRTHLGLISVRRTLAQTPSLPALQGQPRSRLPCKHSTVWLQAEALEERAFGSST